MKTPLEFIGSANQAPAPPTPVNIAVVGPPKSGKSTVARRFAAELGLVTLSPVDIVELLLAKYPKSLIAEKVHAELVSGAAISKALLYQGLDLILMDERAQTRGYVQYIMYLTGYLQLKPSLTFYNVAALYLFD